MAPYFVTVYGRTFLGQGTKFGKVFSDNALHFAYGVNEGDLREFFLGLEIVVRGQFPLIRDFSRRLLHFQ